MTIVVALGGNALQRRGESLDAAVLQANVKLAAAAVAGIVEEHRVVLTHGNGPQVGLLALQNDALADVTPYPLDILDAETEGMIGYLLEQELHSQLPRRRFATLLTQVIVDREDPAFRSPTKPIGPVYDAVVAHALAAARGWTVAPETAGWRRVVASPEPVGIVELDTIALLVEAGVTVLCAGGGGIPVVLDSHRRLHGVEAVIDKDLTASLLATQLRATGLVLLTDVDGVYDGWSGAAPRLIRATTPDELAGVAVEPGSMGPKVEAVVRFVRAGGAFGAIGSLSDARAVARGHAGTVCRAAR